MRKTVNEAALKRMKRIEGQISGIQRMLEENRGCADVLIQIKASIAGLKGVEKELIRSEIGQALQSHRTGGLANQMNQWIDLIHGSG